MPNVLMKKKRCSFLFSFWKFQSETDFQFCLSSLSLLSCFIVTYKESLKILLLCVYFLTHLAATAAESITAHGIMGKRALFTAGASATGTLLQPQDMKNKPSALLQKTPVLI